MLSSADLCHGSVASRYNSSSSNRASSPTSRPFNFLQANFTSTSRSTSDQAIQTLSPSHMKDVECQTNLILQPSKTSEFISYLCSDKQVTLAFVLSQSKEEIFKVSPTVISRH